MTTKIETDENLSNAPKGFETITIDFSDDEFERLMRAAKILNVTIEEFVIQAIIEKNAIVQAELSNAELIK